MMYAFRATSNFKRKGINCGDVHVDQQATQDSSEVQGSIMLYASQATSYYTNAVRRLTMNVRASFYLKLPSD